MQEKFYSRYFYCEVVIYRLNPAISPGLIFQNLFLVRLFLGEPVIMKGGGGFAFQNGLGLPVKTAYSLS